MALDTRRVNAAGKLIGGHGNCTCGICKSYHAMKKLDRAAHRQGAKKEAVRELAEVPN